MHYRRSPVSYTHLDVYKRQLLRYNWQNSWYHNLKNDDQRVTVNVPSRTSRKRYANAAELIMAADEERKIEIISELYDNLRNVIDDESRDALCHEVLEKVNSILNLKNEAVEQTLIADTFGRYFYGQMNDLYEPESEAKAILLIPVSYTHLDVYKRQAGS